MNPPLAQGQTILNKYKIIRAIGEGGMGRVWLAEEIAFGNRQAALKEPRGDLPAAELADVRLRYEREVQVCAELEKAGAPNVVRAITAEPYGEAVLLVLEYLAGGDLAGLIRQHPDGLPVEQAVTIAVALLQALQSAHSHAWEIVHRDIKPSNILLDGQGTARLGDWGLAQRAGMSGRSQLAGGTHPGSPLYMPPEQAASADYLTPAADLFALGCVIFEMTTGKRYKRMKPGTTVASLRGDVPAWLDSVLAKALAAEPWDRYADAAEMQAALTTARPTAAPPAAGRAAESSPWDRYTDAKPPQLAPAAPQKRGFWRWLLEGDEQTPPAADVSPTAPVASAPATRPQLQPARVSVGSAPSFKLRNGREARTLEELVALCIADPPAAVWHLNSGHFESWFKALGHDSLAQKMEKLRKENLPHQTHLQRFLDATGIRHGYKAAPFGDFDWVRIPAGEFLMGSDPRQDSTAQSNEQPQHTVYLPDFYIARTPVTNTQWKLFMENTVRSAPEYWQRGQIPQGKESHPVICVNWRDAMAFCEWAGVRLPTEAEWEKAARGIDGRIYPWGHERPNREYCNFDRASSDGNSALFLRPDTPRGQDAPGVPRSRPRFFEVATTPVDLFPAGASPYGVLDMAGNVWEWTSSLYKAYPYRSNDGREKQTANGKRIVRGGAFDVSWWGVRCDLRSAANPEYREYFIGFRVVSADH